MTKCIHFDKSDIPNGCTCYWDGECNHYCYFKQLKHKEQECEKLKAIVTEAEEAPICFHCSEEPCIRQERDKYKKLSVDFKNVNKHLGHKYITLKKALDEIEKYCEECNLKYDDTACEILGIISKIRET